MTKLIKIEFRSFIPSSVVAGGVPGLTRFFNGGTKGTLSCNIDLDIQGSTSLSILLAEWHETIEYAAGSTEHVSGKPDWYHKLKASPTILNRKTLGRTTSNLDARIGIYTTHTPAQKAFTPCLN